MYELETPSKFSILESHPNPLFPSTLIRYALPKQSFVTLKIQDTLGKEVITLLNETQEAGYHALSWDGLDFNGKQVRESVLVTQITAVALDGSETFVAGKQFRLVH